MTDAPKTIAVVMVCVSSVGISRAQTAGATISGKITDSTGAVIPNAAVSVTNSETNVLRTTITNDEGYFTIPNLLPGNYTLTARLQGMKDSERSGIVLQPVGCPAPRNDRGEALLLIWKDPYAPRPHASHR